MKSSEHRAVGQAATGGALVQVGGDAAEERFSLSDGDVVALSGDFFAGHHSGTHAVNGSQAGPEDLPSDDLFQLAAIPGERGTKLGTRDEIICALKVMAVDGAFVDSRFEPAGQFSDFRFTATAAATKAERRVRDRFLTLATANGDHFVAPGRPDSTHAHNGLRSSRFDSAVLAYRRLHEVALDEACRLGRCQGDESRAMAREAAAQHYLTDAFAAGHLRTPVTAIRHFWHHRGTDASTDDQLRKAEPMGHRRYRVPAPRSSFAGFRFPPDVIMLAVRWYLRYGLSYRDVEELLIERGIQVDHVTVYRWVQRFTPLLVDAARPCRHASGDRWFVDETYVKVAGRWVYLYRAIDQYGQVIDVLVSQKRDLAATRQFFTHALQHSPRPTDVNTDRAPAYPRVLDELLPSACHVVERYANNPVETDHGRLKARLRPMRGLKQIRSVRVISIGHAFIQNVRRGHYELATDVAPRHRLATVFAELTLAV